MKHLCNVETLCPTCLEVVKEAEEPLTFRPRKMKNIKILCASKPVDYLDIYPDFQRELEIRIYNGNRNAAIILSDKKAQELIDYLSDFLKRKHEVPQAS